MKGLATLLAFTSPGDEVYKTFYSVDEPHFLEKVQVATVPGVAFGPSGESHLRINFGREMRDLEEGFARLKDYFFQRQRGKRPPTFSPAEVTQPAPPKEAQLSLIGKGARLLLSHASRKYLKRNSVLVIGIAGIKGKTTVKRTLVDLLRTTYRTRGTILSYNTEVGLPLSILRLKNPKTSSEKLMFPFSLAWQALLGKEKEEILILEYGIRSQKDAETLLEIAIPDWLILSGIEADPHLDYAAITAGIDHIASRIPPEKLLWIADDPFISSMESVQRAPHVIRDSQLANGFLQTSQTSYPCSRETVGTSSARALITSVVMAELLKIPTTTINRFLQT